VEGVVGLEGAVVEDLGLETGRNEGTMKGRSGGRRSRSLGKARKGPIES
jgi:hypothetical protein